tara:strand:+ start:156 stop:1223 length:1068 start_codon:yes stop_codon:yes gene_type:complete
MKNIYTVGAVLLLTTTAATAGGLDRSGQDIGAIFEDGGYVELSYGNVSPSVSGSFLITSESGNIAPSYGAVGIAFKTDINDKVSMAVIMDQPFGAAVEYASADVTYPINGTSAHVNSTAITLVGRYKLSDNLSMFAGPRLLSAEGDYTLIAGGVPLYGSVYASGSGTGYVAGVAYERKEIAMRVALTYSSAIDLELVGSAGDLLARMPASVNLDFQSGVAANTLIFGSIRWADWSDAQIVDSLFGDLVTYDQDTVTYALGVGRKFSDTFSGALSVGYERAQGGIASNLSPTDGNMSIGLGGTYTMDNGVELTGGVRYVMAGDATTSIEVPGAGVFPAEFADNYAIAVGLKVAYTY